MLVRHSVPLVLAWVLAAAGCREVDQRDPAPVLVLAAFDPAAPVIPLPNDLALRAAPNVTDPTLRGALLTVIGLGGWPSDLEHPLWGISSQGIAVPVRAQNFNEGTGAYEPSTTPPAAIDTETVNSQTVAIVKLDTLATISPALVVYTPVTPIAGAGAILLRPVSAATTNLDPGRYVVAVRGGANGVQFLAADGVTRIPLQADLAIALVAPNKDLSEEHNQPPGGLAAQQVAQLEALRASFAAPLDWALVADEDTCVQNVPILPPASFPGLCWLPAPSGSVNPAFAAVDQVFPHEEIASIQTFEVVEVTP